MAPRTRDRGNLVPICRVRDAQAGRGTSRTRTVLAHQPRSGHARRRAPRPGSRTPPGIGRAGPDRLNFCIQASPGSLVLRPRSSSASQRPFSPPGRERWRHTGRRSLLWDLPRPEDDDVDVTLPDRNRRGGLDGVVLHRPRDLVDLAPTRRQGITTAKLLRALTDLGAVDPAEFTRRGPRRHATASPRPPRCVGRSKPIRRRGRHGVRALREALDDWLFDGAALDSELERRMKRLAKRYQLPPMLFHVRDRRLRGRLPVSDADRARVRRMGVPRQAATQVRTGPGPPYRLDGRRLRRRPLHVDDAHSSTAVGGDQGDRSGPPVGPHLVPTSGRQSLRTS